MKLFKLISIAGLLLFSSCAEVMQIAQQTLDERKPLTPAEIASGLKEALIVGTGKSVDILSATDGYYRDEMVKIFLPPEAGIIVDNIGKIPGGSRLLEDVLLRINRAAEDAAAEAGPVFVTSIKAMTIRDAVDILNGADDAATQYLQRTSYDQLFTLFRPRIENSLDKKLVGNISTAQSYNTLVGKWNELARSLPGQLAGFQTVEVGLDEYLTQEALEGLFLKIGEEEKRIRENPAARVNDLLKRVFGTLD